MWHGDPSAWGWLWMATMMIAFWALVVWLVLVVVRGPATRGPDRASDILDERFARGEISADELHRLRDELASHRHR
jgi:putative membrane protein